LTCLQESSALEPAQLPEMLRVYFAATKKTADAMMLTLLGDLRKALIS